MKIPRRHGFSIIQGAQTFSESTIKQLQFEFKLKYQEYPIFWSKHTN